VNNLILTGHIFNICYKILASSGLFCHKMKKKQLSAPKLLEISAYDEK
jgi:hypothetical protein